MGQPFLLTAPAHATAAARAPVSILPRAAALAGSARPLLALVGATLGMAAGFGTLALVSALIPPLQETHGWSRADLSLAYALGAAGMAAGGLLWGRMADRAGLRTMLAIGGTLQALSVFALAAAAQLWQVQAAFLVFGLGGFSCVYAPLLAAAGDWFAARRGLATGIVTAGGALGQGVLPFLATRLIEAQGWRPAMLSIALAVLAVQAFVILVVRRPPASAAHRERTARTPHRLPRRVAALAAAAFACCACMGVPLVHLAGFVGTLCASPRTGAASLLVAMCFGAAGRVGFGLLADRIGALPGYALASAIQTATLLAFPLLRGELPLLALSALFGIGFAGNMTCVILCVRDAAPASRFASAIGLVMFVAWLGMGTGSLLGGLLVETPGGYTAAFLAAAAFGALNLAILAALGSGSTRHALPTISP